MSLNLFLRRLHSEIFLYSERMTPAKSLADAQNLGKTLQTDVYFVVNPGGTKYNDIHSTYCCFVDLDVGRDSQKKYYSDSQVEKKKQVLFDLIDECPVKPHYVVETRNGYQVYWITEKVDLRNQVEKSHWLSTQFYIRQHFGQYADSKVGKPNQIMRLPETVWYKKKERKQPYQTNFVVTPGRFRSFRLSKLNSDFGKIAKVKWVNKPFKQNVQDHSVKFFNSSYTRPIVPKITTSPSQQTPILGLVKSFLAELIKVL